MTRFGIPDYEPRWLNGRRHVTAAHGRRLAGLTGRTLHHVWLLWDLDTDAWFADAPVLIDFGNEQPEIEHQKFDDLSITWNTVDPGRPSQDLNLAWRAEPLPPLAELPGRQLHHVELLEWTDRHDLANGSIAVSFDFGAARLTIFNAVDENGIDTGPPDEHYRAFHLNP